ncbi:MAG: DUF1559 domain-containing protein [Gemmataceae bacterium]|nr:DUF1559 domain-containing protein [Gemmataceae bacterium]MCS7269901.1 DUF1559 domain-containing protein [Gemmataceae bacterium]MDW8243886.1 DUF1559 domain-containing protein [Thermogemmata sp.]
MDRRARRGLSLLEVLVAVAIAAVLAALFFPAVQKVREASARLQCRHQLRQIGLSFHQHHDAHGYLPPGGTHLPPHFPTTADFTATTPVARLRSWSWAYAILPFLDQAPLYQQPNSHVVKGTAIAVYYCPSRRPPQLYDGSGRIDYAGNAGDHPEGLTGLVVRTGRGVVRFADILDGSSQTVLVGEKQLNRSMLGLTTDDNEPYATPGWNDDWDVYRWGAEPPAPDTTRPGSLQGSRVFGSSHPGNFQTVFADGSVRSIRYTVPLTIWRRACVRNDLDPVQLDN